MLDVRAAVVRDLQDDGRQQVERRRAALLDFPADVAGQQHRHLAEAQLDDERVVVAHALALPVRRRRMMDAQLDAADLEPIAALQRAPGGAAAIGVGPQQSRSARGCATGTPHQISRGAKSRTSARAPPM